MKGVGKEEEEVEKPIWKTQIRKFPIIYFRYVIRRTVRRGRH
jgi:hypothetical protein